MLVGILAAYALPFRCFRAQVAIFHGFPLPISSDCLLQRSGVLPLAIGLIQTFVCGFLWNFLIFSKVARFGFFRSPMLAIYHPVPEITSAGQSPGRLARKPAQQQLAVMVTAQQDQ